MGATLLPAASSAGTVSSSAWTPSASGLGSPTRFQNTSMTASLPAPGMLVKPGSKSLVYMKLAAHCCPPLDSTTGVFDMYGTHRPRGSHSGGLRGASHAAALASSVVSPAASQGGWKTATTALNR